MKKKIIKNIRHFFNYNNLIVGIKNIWKWKKVIYKDRDYDYSYILDVLIFKLKDMKLKHYVDCEIDMQKISLCVKLLERVRDGYYEMEYMDYFETHFKFTPVPGDEQSSYMDLEVLEDNSVSYFDKYKRTYKQVSSDYKDLKPERGIMYRNHDIALSMSLIIHKKAHRIAFKLLEQYIDRWWW